MLPSPAPVGARGRLAPIDWMRGLVMLLMTVDHSSDAFNGGRVFTDAVFAWKPGTVLPAAQFLTRWVTHLCAPTFVFLAGASLALMATRRARAGESPWQIDRQMIIRGLFIAAMDPLWMSGAFFGWSAVLLQVLYAIGISMVCMAGLRRLPPRLLALLGVALVVGVDLVLSPILEASVGAGRPPAPWPIGLLISGGRYSFIVVAYPVASWLGIMCLGWAFGSHLSERMTRSANTWDPARLLAISGVISLVTFAVLRGVDKWGNMGLHRDDNSIIQWIHVAKYPPSVTYATLELGIMALCLSLFFVIARDGIPRLFTPLGIFGSSAMLYYLLHAHLMIGSAHLLGINGKYGVGAAWLGAACCAALLYYPCLRYSRYKASHANWFTRLV